MIACFVAYDTALRNEQSLGDRHGVAGAHDIVIESLTRQFFSATVGPVALPRRGVLLDV